MEDYLDSIVRPILTKPEAFTVTKSADDMGILLTVSLAKEDMGNIIGKSGQNILSIRRIVGMYGMQHNAKISIKINEPIGGKYYQA